MSPSSYYAWRNRPPSQREMANRELKVRIREVFEESGQTYGSPRIYQILRKLGLLCSQKRVVRLMRGAGLRAKQARRFRNPHAHRRARPAPTRRVHSQASQPPPHAHGQHAAPATDATPPVTAPRQ